MARAGYAGQSSDFTAAFERPQQLFFVHRPPSVEFLDPTGLLAEDIERKLTDSSAEILDNYHTVAVAELDVDDRGVLIWPILVGFGGNLTSIFVVEHRR
jgi:hypothetical protein